MTEFTRIPRSMEDLREVLGERAFLRLLLAYPGMDLKVPVTVAADHPLARAIGLEPAQKLAQHAGGGRMYIPSSFARAERNQAIYDGRAAGDSVEQIARRHGLTVRYVERILVRYVVPPSG